MFNKKSIVECRNIIGRLITITGFGSLLLIFFLFFSGTAVAEEIARSVLIANCDNDAHFSDDQSIDVFKSVLENMGYNVTVEKLDNVSYFDMIKYKIAVSSCGDDTTPLYKAQSKRILIDYVTDGGHLILEGGNIASYLDRFDTENLGQYKDEFRKEVAHVTTDFVYDDVGNLTLSNRHPITNTPNLLPDTIEFIPTDPGDDSGDADAARILPDAVGVYNWSYVNYRGQPANKSATNISYGLVAYDNDSDLNNGGQIVYYLFDIDDIASAEIQHQLIENSVNWLDPSPSPTSTLLGSKEVTPTPILTPTPIPTTPASGFEFVLGIIGLSLTACFLRMRNKL